MKFVRKHTQECTLAEIQPGDCFRFPGTNSMAYMRLLDVNNAMNGIYKFASVESGHVGSAAGGTIVIPIDVELREL